MESVRAVTSRLVCLVVVAAVEVEVTGAAVRAEASLVKAAETVEGVVVRVGMTAKEAMEVAMEAVEAEATSRAVISPVAAEGTNPAVVVEVEEEKAAAA